MAEMKQKNLNSICGAETKEFREDLRQLALPVTLQSLLQSSFSIVDQIMAGQLGSVSVAAIGLSGKFISLLTVMVSALSAAAGIIIAQAIGKNEKKQAGKGFFSNLLLALVISSVFLIISTIFPKNIISLYSKDSATVSVAANYLRIYGISFLPMAITSVMSAYLRCVNSAKIPLYAGIMAAAINTVLNYMLIFGNMGFPKLGISGAAWASVISQVTGGVILLIFSFFPKNKINVPFGIYSAKKEIKNYLYILLPMFVCEFLWVLGENVYGLIYGHLGTKDCAAMTLINPIVSLMIGALSGVAQAAGIMVGKLLGASKENKAYITGKKLMKTGLIFSVFLSVLLLLLKSFYVEIFNVESDVKNTTEMILTAFAVVSPIKVQNMILGGGILRSGGKTKYVMGIDIIGTWVFGVPIGLAAAFILKLPIAWVYFLLSLEEGVRLIISLIVFRRKDWMQKL